MEVSFPNYRSAAERDGRVMAWLFEDAVGWSPGRQGLVAWSKFLRIFASLIAQSWCFTVTAKILTLSYEFKKTGEASSWIECTWCLRFGLASAAVFGPPSASDSAASMVTHFFEFSGFNFVSTRSGDRCDLRSMR
jgi:hypothetical protein